MFNRHEDIKTVAMVTPERDQPPRAGYKPRHFVLIFSFILFVLAPTVATIVYMSSFARDRFVSRAEFSIRTNEPDSPLAMLGGLAQLTGSSSSSDTEVLYNYIQSPDMVTKVDERVDLRAAWGEKAGVNDPVFTYGGSDKIEDLLSYWRRMVHVSQNSDGILKVQVQAFSPADAQAIAKVLFDQSQQMINELSAIAREDSTRYAREEMDKASEQLKQARVAINRFRNETQILDPAAAIQSQVGVMSSLQQQLASTMVERGILEQTAPSQDPRIQQINRRIEVIEAQVQSERNKLGSSNAQRDNDVPFADLLSQYEELAVDQTFAQQRYTAALATYDVAIADSQRKTRYLGAYVAPTLPQSSEYPQRALNVFFVLLLAFLAWSITVLTIYAVRERR